MHTGLTLIDEKTSHRIAKKISNCYMQKKNENNKTMIKLKLD